MAGQRSSSDGGGSSYTPVTAEANRAFISDSLLTLQGEQQQQQGLAQQQAMSCGNPGARRRDGLAFWLLGLLNNSPYVIMIASAKNIIDGGTALVFLANVLPAFLLKLSAPYWFDRVSYKRRIQSATALLVTSLFLVAIFSNKKREEVDDDDGGENKDDDSIDMTALVFQLLGVALGSAMAGLGEATLLAAAGKCDATRATDASLSSATAAAAAATTTTNAMDHGPLRNDQNPAVLVVQDDNEMTRGNSNGDSVDSGDSGGGGVCITCFSSGTGLAGVFGFLWKYFWNDWMGFRMSTMLWLAQSLAVSYLVVFLRFLSHLDDTAIEYNQVHEEQEDDAATHDGEHVTRNSNAGEDTNPATMHVRETTVLNNPQRHRGIATTTTTTTTENNNHTASMNNNNGSIEMFVDEDGEKEPLPVHDMGFVERLRLVVSLWPYIIPLFLVYWAEYSLQAGVWTAIGFPVESEKARDKFYEYSNWTYQLGVFVSRSSGTVFTAPMSVLWIMPLLQVGNVVCFYYVASEHVWYSYGYLMPCCFYVGLLGGSVYVHGYKRICRDIAPLDRREFGLATTSVAESLGIVSADVLGLFIQSCLYRWNSIPGAIVSCPVSYS